MYRPTPTEFRRIAKLRVGRRHGGLELASCAIEEGENCPQTSPFRALRPTWLLAITISPAGPIPASPFE